MAVSVVLSELLNILIIGVFVVLFASILRKRDSARLQFWVAGWMLVLLHFTAQLTHPASDFGQSLSRCCAISTLLLSGICFLLSSSPVSEDFWGSTLVASMIAAPALFYTNYLVFGGSHTLPLYIAASSGSVGGIALAWNFYRQRSRVLATVTLTYIVGECWTVYAIAHGRAGDGISAFLAEIFLTFAALYWFDFRRISAGVATAVLGLVAWASVFPVSLLCRVLMPSTPIPGELWNLPKYVVAFGMILTLLEDEISSAADASEHYRLLFAANPHPMWIYQPETLRFLDVNDAAIQHYGYSREEFLSMTMHDLRPPEAVGGSRSETSPARLTKSSEPWLHRKKDGSCIEMDVTSHAINFQGRRCRFALAQDVTERQRLHAQLVHQAHHDTLTGLPNRLLLEDRMQQALVHAARKGQRAAILCIDLDRFKQINDNFGHAAGDLCLQQVASRISARLRAVDTVARAGGEEFVIVLGELDAVDNAQVVARDVLECLRQPVEGDGFSLQVSASLGIAVYPDDGADAAELWRSADAAMYRAKQSGGGQYLLASSAGNCLTGEAEELERFMGQALEEGGFEIHYQPQHSISGRLCGLEALLRLTHPLLGAIAPSRFFPVAEQCGLAGRLGDWLLHAVCRQIAEWRKQGLEPVRVAVKVSPLQFFMRPDFSKRVLQALHEHDLDPKLLELEITESTVLRNLSKVGRETRNLAAQGVSFSVDHFGLGYSCLSQLHQLPVSALKIDRSFVERVSDVNGTASIVQAIVALAHSLSLRVAAEGVEREDQLECLRRLGCDVVQGLLLGAPAPGLQIPSLLKPKPLPVRKHPGAHPAETRAVSR